MPVNNLDRHHPHHNNQRNRRGGGNPGSNFRHHHNQLHEHWRRGPPPTLPPTRIYAANNSSASSTANSNLLRSVSGPVAFDVPPPQSQPCRQVLAGGQQQPPNWIGGRRPARSQHRASSSRPLRQQQQQSGEPMDIDVGGGAQQQQQQTYNNVGISTSCPSTSSAPPDIPGFYWDAARGKYFRMMDTHLCTPSAANYGVGQQHKDKESARQKWAAVSEQQWLQQQLASRPSVTAMLHSRQLGMRNCRQPAAFARQVDDLQVMHCAQKPTAVHEALPNHPDEPLDGCQFLECSADGSTLIGSWKLNTPWARNACSRIMCLSAEHTPARQKAPDKPDHILPAELNFTPTDHYIYAFDPSVVDFCQAPVDTSVTCVLYVTEPTLPESGSRVFLQPVPDLSCEEHTDNYYSPIYNIHWTLRQGVTSCAWNSAQMRVALGLDTASLVVDVQSETDFKLSTRHKRVLTHKFSKDGHLLFCGLRANPVLCCDLRLPAHHIVCELPDTSSVQWMYLTDNQQLLTSDLHGNMRAWDTRQRRQVHAFEGHQNTAGWKLPHCVDNEQKYLFAASSDGSVRGWSLSSSELLCRVAPDDAVGTAPGCAADVPRVCYSARWGDRHANAALVTAQHNTIYVYDMTHL